MIHPNSEISEFDIIIIGATGDLSIRKIIPALFKRYADRQIPEKSKIYCLARQKLDNLSFTQKISQQNKIDFKNSKILKEFFDKINYLCIDIKSPDSKNLFSLQKKLTKDRVRLFYLATAPELFGVSAQFIRENNLANNKTRIIVEKPIGKDLISAIDINKALNSYFDEDQIYRIDHYLGKETVQNLMVMRFANQLFEAHWNNNSISNVQITVSEEIGIKGRENYYDSYGAIKDMMQNHILQLVCLVAMEPPSKFDANLVRDEKLKVLQSLKKIEDLNEICIGQYGLKNDDEDQIASYTQDSKKHDSKTETFVALMAKIDNWRWAGVPFFLRTGKRLKTRASEIVITFKPIQHFIFDKIERIIPFLTN